MKILPAAVLGIVTLSGVNAEAAVRIRMPWEKPPRQEDTRRDPDPRPYPGDRRGDGRYDGRYDERYDSEDAYFLRRMHASLREEMAFADAVRRENRIPEVRRFAERTLAETRAFDEDLRRRAADLGIRLDDSRYDARDLTRLGDGEMAVEWLRLSMDVVERDRYYWSEFKKAESNRAFHDVLQYHWDHMVDRRDDAKDLHDRIRNDMRRRRHSS